MSSRTNIPKDNNIAPDTAGDNNDYIDNDCEDNADDDRDSNDNNNTATKGSNFDEQTETNDDSTGSDVAAAAAAMKTTDGDRHATRVFISASLSPLRRDRQRSI